MTTMLGVPLAPGARRRTFVALIVCNFLMVVASGTLVGVSPWILTNLLHVPAANEGKIQGLLQVLYAVVLVLLFPLFGVLADRLGRRWGLFGGFLLMALSLPVLAYAKDLASLILSRTCVTIGFACASACVSAALADVAEDKHRGKATGVLGMALCFGILFMSLVALNIPKMLETKLAGARVEEVARVWFAIIGAIVATGLPFVFWLPRRSPAAAKSAERPSLGSILKQVSRLVKKQPLIALALAGGFTQSGDSALGLSFIVLWLNRHATTVLNLSPQDAAQATGRVLGLGVLSMIISSPIAGILTDRIGAPKVIAASLLATFLAMVAMHLVEDPFGSMMAACFVVYMSGQLVAGIASMALIAARAPEALRGSVTGMFSASAAAGMLIFTVTGGIVYDAWGPSGPFLILSVVNLAVVVGAVLLIIALRDERAGR
jgi:MFS family permease